MALLLSWKIITISVSVKTKYVLEHGFWKVVTITIATPGLSYDGQKLWTEKYSYYTFNTRINLDQIVLSYCFQDKNLNIQWEKIGLPFGTEMHVSTEQYCYLVYIIRRFTEELFQKFFYLILLMTQCMVNCAQFLYYKYLSQFWKN